MRIGIHTGEAIRQAGDFFGRSVVLAARIADYAEGGDILVSSLVRELIAGRADVFTRPAGQAEFKGLDGRHELFRVAWTPPETTAAPDEVPPPALRPEDTDRG